MTPPQYLATDKRRLLLDIQDELDHLPTLPSAVARIIQAANDPGASAKKLTDIISIDQSFASKVLRLANSPYYGFAGKITTITQAVVVLGFSAVRNLAASLGVSKGFGYVKSSGIFDLDAFWSHSIATACAASVIGRRKHVGAKLLEECFIGGLLHDIGKLFFVRYIPAEYSDCLRYARTEHCNVWLAEKATLGITHAEIGRQIALKWNFPADTIAMIAHHHEPATARANMASVSIVHAGNYVAKRLGLGSSGDSVEPELAPEVDQWMNFLPNVWLGLEQETRRKFEAASDLLHVMSGK
jgi:putative nucleotidyltransferase with HDIG domain